MSPRIYEPEQQFIQNGGEFRTCKASKLFKIKANPQLDKVNFVFSHDSKYPYFTRTVANNGILGYVDYLDEEHKICGNSIAVGMLGMKFFYMGHDFYAGQFTKTAFPLFDGFNERVALWFIAWFNKSSKRYQSVLVRDFETEFNNTEIVVPYINGKVAVKFIEERVCELEEGRMRELEAYLTAAGFDDCNLTEEEQEAVLLIETGKITMKKMRIVDNVFNVKNSHNILKSDVVFGSGNVPYVTASEGNNSIVSYISYNEDEKEEGNTILIGGKTLVITYQPQAFFTNDSHNLVLRALNEDAQEEDTQLYLVASLYKSLSHKYTWGNSISKQKIQSDTMYLPISANGEVDYQLMKDYIRAVKKECITRLKTKINGEQKLCAQNTVNPPTKSSSSAQ